jgi:thioredoxin 2
MSSRRMSGDVGDEMTQETTARPVTVRCPFCERLNRVDLARVAAGPKCGPCGRPLLLDRPVKTTEADFDETIRSASVPVLVDCYADWCGPCRMMAPALDELARERTGHLLVLKLDTDRNQALSMRLGIRGIPTLIVYRGGGEVGRHVGIAQLAQLRTLVGLG